MTLKDLIEGDLNFYTQSFGGNKAIALTNCMCAFNSYTEYTDNE